MTPNTFPFGELDLWAMKNNYKVKIQDWIYPDPDPNWRKYEVVGTVLPNKYFAYFEKKKDVANPYIDEHWEIKVVDKDFHLVKRLKKE